MRTFFLVAIYLTARLLVEPALGLQLWLIRRAQPHLGRG